MAAETIVMSPKLKWLFMQYCPVGLSDDVCWPWRAGCDAYGYGVLTYKRRTYKATRLSYMIFNQLETFSEWALHDCDNPICINPTHLFAGDNDANIKDRQAKNRQAVGMMNGLSKLTAETVLEIKRKLNFGQSQKSIAIEHGVSSMTISLINQGKTWKGIS